jgi:hypothetical protein
MDRRVQFLANHYLQSPTNTLPDNTFYNYAEGSMLRMYGTNTAASDIGITIPQRHVILTALQKWLKKDVIIKEKDKRPLIVFSYNDPVKDGLRLKEIFWQHTDKLPPKFRARAPRPPRRLQKP